MKIRDLVRKFKDGDYKDASFIIMLNEVSNYVMYEQAIVKKDNNVKDSIIKYRYDEESYKYINDFFSGIVFLSKPIIGDRKKVNIKNLPSEYNYENKHEFSFNDKIYLLDKIKDSFMHLNEDETLFDIDLNEKGVVIKNITSTYSLECKIPFVALYKFNRYIKMGYDNSSPTLDWIDDFFYKKRRSNVIHRVLWNNKSLDLYEMRLRKDRKVLFVPGKNYYSFYERRSNVTGNIGDNNLSKKEYDSYYTNSYVSLLMASSDEMNYPLLKSIYDFDFHCEHPSYVLKMSSIMKKITSFYSFIYNNIDYIGYDSLKQRILEFIYSNGQNCKKNGLLVDISDINNMIVKKFMRNARSHANNKGIANSSIGNETIVYYDVLYNSLQNDVSEKSVPSFSLVGKRKELNNFFDEVTECSLSNQGLYDQIINDLCLGKKDSFELFLQQLSKLIEQASKDKIEYSEYLKAPVGNANNFVDFIRKIMDGSFEYENGKCIKKKL